MAIERHVNIERGHADPFWSHWSEIESNETTH
jgi:hypothetical protein